MSWPIVGPIRYLADGLGRSSRPKLPKQQLQGATIAPRPPGPGASRLQLFNDILPSNSILIANTPRSPAKMAPSAISTTTTELAPQKVIEKKKTPLELISQGTPLPGIPQFVSFATHRQWMLEHMAIAFRVFARKGYTEGMSGHISVRDPENPHTFWTNPLGRHFGLLKASDMILVDYEGKAIGGNMSRPANAAGFLIHSAVHKARPDVVAGIVSKSSLYEILILILPLQRVTRIVQRVRHGVRLRSRWRC